MQTAAYRFLNANIHVLFVVASISDERLRHDLTVRFIVPGHSGFSSFARPRFERTWQEHRPPLQARAKGGASFIFARLRLLTCAPFIDGSSENQTKAANMSDFTHLLFSAQVNVVSDLSSPPFLWLEKLPPERKTQERLLP
jgi:hypothetical protein